ncbi:LysR family transcriptional regulator [Vibrio breoganii]|uniref:LysR substrate-binding domain-containing protein n=1 Tax=Vibrio breoganii TaxID=553239 RepID=UPI000C82728E|nr:LysR substrate-binding domain-containing protein [Vibrio breoganii]PMG04528.1 transcriptional regulator [Vibrio breoganii]TKG27388.1 LysR family transcriptional regulator [Vibrio breoganii]
MNTRLPSTKNLQAFLATAEHLNFTHAAQAMNMTQGAISRQIQSLEELVGVALFYRQARGLALTPEGSKLIPMAEDILVRLRKAVIDVADRSNKIKLNAPSCVTSWLLPRLMSFQQENPDIEVELTSSIKHQLLPNFESFDLVIVYGRPPRSLSVSEHVLFEEKLTPICSPELWKKVIGDEGQWNDKDLARFTWLHANPMQSDWNLWLEKSGSIARKGRRNQTFSTLDQAMNAAQQGFGIAVGDITLAEEDLKLNRLMQPYTDYVTSGQSYYLLRPAEAQSAAIDDFLAWLLPE